MAIKTKYKVIFGTIAVFGVLGLAKCGMDSGLIPAPAAISSMIPKKTDARLSGDVVAGAPAQNYELVAQPVSNVTAPVRVLSIPWNGMASLAVANGGASTRPGSAVAKYTGGTVQIERQDDYAVMKTELLKFAEGVKRGDTNPDGAAFTIIMGDGYPAFIAGLQPLLKKMGQQVAVVGVAGFSYGEDKCMGRPINGNPQNAKGSLIAAVPYDGDWNICVKWASDNGIAINTDQSTYDPDAINFMDTPSFTMANKKFIASACEERTIVHGGLKTKEVKTVCVDGVATWTPGDVDVVTQKGGIVTWASTREYNQQMPAVIIGNVEWMNKNREFVVGLLKAVDRGSFTIRTEANGLSLLGNTQAEIFGQAGGPEASPQFWSKYYVGEEIRDTQGNKVRLGGSRAATLAEIRDFFGLGDGAYNVYKGVYDVFGGYARTFYPNDVPEIPDFNKVVDTSFVEDALKGVTMTARRAQFAAGTSITRAVSTRAYSIEFDTGTATIRPESLAVLRELANQSGMTGLRINIYGHTDNTGNDATNFALSKARAQAIADWLFKVAPATFPRERMEVKGYGSSMPVGDNATVAGRQANRRVEITLGE